MDEAAPATMDEATPAGEAECVGERVGDGVGATGTASHRMNLSTPSTCKSAADPRVFDDQEAYQRLFDDAGLRQAKQVAN